MRCEGARRNENIVETGWQVQRELPVRVRTHRNVFFDTDVVAQIGCPSKVPVNHHVGFGNDSTLRITNGPSQCCCSGSERKHQQEYGGR